MKILDTLIQQATFLVEQQKNIRADIEYFFDQLLKAANTKQEEINPGDQNYAELENIIALMNKQLSIIREHMEQTGQHIISNLAELQTIASVQDEQKQEKMLSLALDQTKQIRPMEEFSRIVFSRLAQDTKTRAALLELLKTSIANNNFAQVTQGLSIESLQTINSF
jgi:hypothetical protein